MGKHQITLEQVIDGAMYTILVCKECGSQVEGRDEDEVGEITDAVRDFMRREYFVEVT